MNRQHLVYFSSTTLDVPGLVHRRTVASIVEAATLGVIRALIVDARTPEEFFRAHEVLRALYDDPRRGERLLHPGRVLALIATGDTAAAFSFGRFGIAGILEARALGDLEPCLREMLASRFNDLPLTAPALAPPRPTHLRARGETELPTVTVAYRHAPETLGLLDRYTNVLRACAQESTVFADVATLLEVMVGEGLTCQTNLAAKAGAMHTGQYIGSFEFYRTLRRTRYGRIPDHPTHAVAMEVFIAVDEVLHEVLHLLYLANEFRAGIVPTSTLFAEEMSLTWWQAVVHNRVFPSWLADRHILEINDDFMLSEHNQDSRGFWKVGTVFSQYIDYPWVPYVLTRLPDRPSYIGQRPDLAELIGSFTTRAEAAFLRDGAVERLAIPVQFNAYPPVPPTLRVGYDLA